MAIAGVHKAAIVLSSLPEMQAAELLSQLSAAESEAVRRQIDSLGPIGRRRRQVVLQEFAARATTHGTPSSRNCQPSDAANDLAAPACDPPPFQFLCGMAPVDLATLLADEHPQTIALVLSHLPADCAGEVLSAMPAESQAPIIRRIATMDEPDAEVIGDVEEAIRRRLGGVENGETCIGIASVIKMLGAMRPTSERQLLDDIAQADPDLFGVIRRAMFGVDVAACETACETAPC